MKARALAEAFAARHPAEKLRWGWEDAIWLYGLSKLGGWDAYIARFHARAVPRIDRSDLCAPALTAPDGAAVAAYVARAPRSEGAIEHLGDSPMRFLYPRSVWVDSLMMVAVFAARWGARHDKSLMNLALDQPIAFARLLQDARTDLFRHAWLVPARRAVGGFWLRGNGWVVASLVDLLEVEPRRELVTLLDRVVRALVARQRADGSWSTLVGTDAYAETSGTALVAYAIAKGVRNRWLAAELRAHADRAIAWLETQVDGGSLCGISGPTNALPAFTYRLIPRRRNLAYGVGAYLMAASEVR